MATSSNLFLSPVGLADFAILHEPRKWSESHHKSIYDAENGEYSTGLVIGNEEGKHFKTIVDGYVQKKLTETIEEAFADLKENKPKKVDKYKNAMDWQKAENVFTPYYPYTQIEDEDGEALDAWKFKFKRKAKTMYRDKASGEQKEYTFIPLFANKEGEPLGSDYFEENGLIGNDSEMRIRYKPYSWVNKKNEVGVKLDIYHIQLLNHIPYQVSGSQDKGPLFDPL
jgi:hypothetical protein